MEITHGKGRRRRLNVQHQHTFGETCVICLIERPQDHIEKKRKTYAQRKGTKK